MQEWLQQLPALDQGFASWQDPSLSVPLHQWNQQTTETMQHGGTLASLRERVMELRGRILVSTIFGRHPLYSNTPWIETTSKGIWDEMMYCEFHEHEPTACDTFRVHEFAQAIFAWLDRAPVHVYPYHETSIKTFPIVDEDPQVREDAQRGRFVFYHLSIIIPACRERQRAWHALNEETLRDVQVLRERAAAEETARQVQAWAHRQAIAAERAQLQQQKSSELCQLYAQHYAQTAALAVEQGAMRQLDEELTQLREQLALSEGANESLKSKLAHLHHQCEELRDDIRFARWPFGWLFLD